MKEFFEVLFDYKEGVCTGNAYATEVTDYAGEGEYFCVNPLDLNKDHAAFLNEKYDEKVARRADLNVSSFRNFMFEIDSLPLEAQLKLFQTSSIPFSTIVFSGGKSYHAILSVDPSAIEGCHTREGIDNYKLLWRRLAAKLDREAVKQGHSYPEGCGSFIDPSCKNPSRLTRYPEFVRSNGNFQSLIMLTERISKEDFDELIESCPRVLVSKKENFDTPEDEVDTLDGFEAICPPELMRKLKYVDWAKSEGMYPFLYAYSLWAIDSTNVTKDAFVDFLDKYTFKSLIRRGYPSNRLMTAVDHAFREKGK